MKRRPLPTQRRLRELFIYCPLTGNFTNSRGVAGCVRKQKGYSTRLISVDGKQYVASRLAWMYMTGQDPCELEIDHIDRNSLNDCFCNLRLADRSLNSLNRSVLPKGSQLPSGVNFAHKSTKMKSKPYQATVCVNKRRIAKYFATVEEAVRWREDQLRNAFACSVIPETPNTAGFFAHI